MNRGNLTGIVLIFCFVFNLYAEEDLRLEMKNSPVRQLRYWEEYQKKLKQDDLYKAPEELIDYVTLDNKIHNYPERPEPANLGEEQKAIVKKVIEGIPGKIKKAVRKKLTGVFFVKDLGSSGFTDVVFDKDKPVKGFMIFDVSVLQKKANEWATWKENTPFFKSSKYGLKAIIEKPENDNVENAFLYIFLHELGHLLTINSKVMPLWAVDGESKIDISKYPFLSLSWKTARKGDVISLFDRDFKEIKSIKYYMPETSRANAAKMKRIYDDLENTNFPTLYAATNIYDDFAECFVTYVHSVMLKKPFAVQIYRKGKLVKTFHLCWNTDRCLKKQGLIKDFVEKL